MKKLILLLTFILFNPHILVCMENNLTKSIISLQKKLQKLNQLLIQKIVHPAKKKTVIPLQRKQNIGDLTYLGNKILHDKTFRNIKITGNTQFSNVDVTGFAQVTGNVTGNASQFVDINITGETNLHNVEIYNNAFITGNLHAITSSFKNLQITGSLYFDECDVTKKVVVNLSPLSGTYNLTFEGGQMFYQRKGFKITINNSSIKKLVILNTSGFKKQKIRLNGDTTIQKIKFINITGIVNKERSVTIGKVINRKIK
jgi:DNA-binding protein YbaB